MKRCFFELNGQPMSQFVLGIHRFAAYSGHAEYVNKRDTVCALKGAIPPGEYFILDRETGGRLGWFRGRGKEEWFSLYANDGKIDDNMLCHEQERKHFRLHPKGELGLSHGCIVINNELDFKNLAKILRQGKPKKIVAAPGSLLVWGKVVVR